MKKRYIFRIGDNTNPQDWGIENEEEWNEIKAHDNKPVLLTGVDIKSDDPNDYRHGYYEIMFADGLTLDGISGFNLIPKA